MAALDDFRPHVVIVFRPEIIPAGLFHGLDAATLGFLTEPIPRMAGRPARRSGRAPVGARAHGPVELRPLRLVRPPHLGHGAARAADLALDATARADRFYAPVRRIDGLPRVVFVGHSTPYRERFLMPVQARVRPPAPRFRRGRGPARRGDARPRGRHQHPQRGVPLVREPDLPAPRGRAPRPLGAAQSRARSRAGPGLRRDQEPEPAPAPHRDAAPLPQHVPPDPRTGPP